MRSLRRILFWLRRCATSWFDAPHNAFMWRLNDVRRNGPVKVCGRLYIRNAGFFSIGKGVKINSSMFANPIGGDTRTFIVVSENAALKIGNNVGLSNVTIYCASEIVIGDDVLIGGGCRIYDTDFHPVGYAERIIETKKGLSAPVLIDHGAWLCADVKVLKGVHVGARSVVAAGSVVADDIPADELWGGVPARFIRKINR